VSDKVDMGYFEDPDKRQKAMIALRFMKKPCVLIDAVKNFDTDIIDEEQIH